MSVITDYRVQSEHLEAVKCDMNCSRATARKWSGCNTVWRKVMKARKIEHEGDVLESLNSVNL